MKHTPGPWNQLFQEPNNQIKNKTWTLCGPPSLKPTPILIAGIYNSVPSEANARLIAAAPELFNCTKEALKMVQIWRSDIETAIIDAQDKQFAMTIIDIIEAKCLAAISKAEGRTE